MKGRPEPANTLIFIDSIPKGIRVDDFNKLIKNRKAKMVTFPGASLHGYSSGRNLSRYGRNPYWSKRSFEI